MEIKEAEPKSDEALTQLGIEIQKEHKKRRNSIIIFFVVMIMLVPIAYAIALPNEAALEKEDLGIASASDFSAVDVVTGETISLSQFKGSKILLNFVNYGCNQRTNQIVSAQLLDIKSLIEQRDDFIPVSVFCGCCPVDTLRDFATENELSWSWILDTDNSIVQNYLEYIQTYGYPTLVFINKYQNIEEFSGYCDTPTLSDKLDKL